MKDNWVMGIETIEEMTAVKWVPICLGLIWVRARVPKRYLQETSHSCAILNGQLSQMLGDAILMAS